MLNAVRRGVGFLSLHARVADDYAICSFVRVLNVVKLAPSLPYNLRYLQPFYFRATRSFFSTVECSNVLIAFENC